MGCWSFKNIALCTAFLCTSVLLSCFDVAIPVRRGEGIVGAQRRLKAGGTVFLEDSVSEAEFRLIGDAANALGFARVGTQSRVPPYEDLLYQRLDHDNSGVVSLRLTYHVADAERRPRIRWMMQTERILITEELWTTWSETLVSVRQLLAEQSDVKRTDRSFEEQAAD